MLQSYSSATSPTTVAARVAALRAKLAEAGFDGMIVPRADAHQGEYVAPRDQRLAWLTSFTGSAGFAIVLPKITGLFVDGRYTIQADAQTDLSVVTPVPYPGTRAEAWVPEQISKGRVAFDPWLHTSDEVARLRAAWGDAITLEPAPNFVDAVWEDQPAPPMGAVSAHPMEYAGKTSVDKRAELADALEADAAVITQPDSIAWLLNVRGSDIERVPLPHSFAILHKTGRVDWFIAPEKLPAEIAAHLGNEVSLHAADAFEAAVAGLKGRVAVDKATAPYAVAEAVTATRIWARDPVTLPKACKNPVEIAGTRAAHLRDGAAMVEFLAWIDREAGNGQTTEIDVAQKLEDIRHATGALKDISFETISAAGPNAALPHYRVSDESNRVIRQDDILLVDSGGQYLDGTTDITRTVAIGAGLSDARHTATLVLKGMIAISRMRWPEGLAGRDLDPFARAALWADGKDFDHGTGHGVGSYLSVHEGPQRLSRISHERLKPGMILSNEPGYYREGDYGIRIENLVVVEAAGGSGERPMMSFETITFAPIDKRLMDISLMTAAEQAWIDAYHADVWEKLADDVSPAARDWLKEATRPL